MSAPGPDVTVVVVAYNCAPFLGDCLSSILGGQGTSPRAEIVVVDNASSDDSVGVARSFGHSVRVVRNEENVGFGAAVNQAAATSRALYLLLVNPDAVLAPGAIAELVAFADAHEGHGLYGGRAVEPDGTLDPKSCWGLPSLWSMFCFATGLSSVFDSSPLFNPTALPGWGRDTVREVGAISGCLLLARRSAWDALGGFDEDFFLYGEDIDLGARARAAGFRPVVVPTAQVVHAVGGSTPEAAARTILLLRGRATYLRKRWAQPAQLIGLALLQGGVAGRAAVESLTARRRDVVGRRWRTAWASRRGWVAGYVGSPGARAGASGQRLA